MSKVDKKSLGKRTSGTSVLGKVGEFLALGPLGTIAYEHAKNKKPSGGYKRRRKSKRRKTKRKRSRRKRTMKRKKRTGRKKTRRRR